MHASKRLIRLALLISAFFFLVDARMARSEGSSGGTTTPQAIPSQAPAQPDPVTGLAVPAVVDPGVAPHPVIDGDRLAQSKRAKKEAEQTAQMQQITCVIMAGAAVATGSPVAGAMAVTQCMQAEATRKSAKDNDDAAKAVTWDPGRPPSVTMPTFNTPKDPPKDDSLIPALQAMFGQEKKPDDGESSDSPAPTAAAEAQPAAQPVEQAVAKPAGDDKPADTVGLVADASSQTTALKPIEPKVGYDENRRQGEGVTYGRDDKPAGNPTAPNAKAAEAARADQALRAELGARGLEKIEGRLVKSVENAPGASEGGGAKGEHHEERDAEGSMDALMSILKGGGGGGFPDAPSAMAGSGEVVTLKQGANDDDAVANIFQFATYRFRKAATVEKRVRAPGEKPVPPQKIASIVGTLKPNR